MLKAGRSPIVASHVECITLLSQTRHCCQDNFNFYRLLIQCSEGIDNFSRPSPTYTRSGLHGLTEHQDNDPHSEG